MIDTYSDKAQLDAIRDFKEGYAFVLEKQNGYVESTKSLMSSALLNSEERNALGTKRSQIDQALKEIGKLTTVTVLEIGSAELEKDAKKDYHNIFTGDHEPSRLKFIEFLKSYILLKKFSVAIAGHWTQIEYLIKELNFAKNSEFQRQIINYNIVPAIKNTEAINVFCQRMKRILKLKRDPENSKKLDGLAEYTSGIDYKLSFVFTVDLDQELESLFDQHTPDAQQLPESSFPAFESFQKSSKGKIQPAVKKEVYQIDTSGNQNWNRTPDYYFQYDPRVLERERSVFPNVIYLDSHMGADQKFIKTDLILNFSRKREAKEIKDVENEYEAFLGTFFNLVNEISALNMNIPGNLRNPFMYHLGPTSYYNLTIKFLQEVNTGKIHCKVAGGKMIRKFIPGELIKKITLNYWQNDVMNRIDFDKNDYALFKKLTALVKSMHSQLMENASQEFEKLPESIRKSKSKSDIYRENASSWIGATNIVIFKRFLQNRKA